MRWSDGSATAATFVSPANAADGYMAGFVPNPSLYDGQQVTASVYLRTLPGVASQSVQLFVIDFGSQYSGGSIASTTTAALTSTWQRFALTATLENGLSQLYLQLDGGGTVHNGQGFEIWGPQFVVGGDPGAYTPTASVTTVYATGAAGTLVPTGLNESYSYDSFGNMLSNGSFQASYDNNNRMFGYAYDAAGNLLSDRVANIMTWDAESRLSSVAGTTYIYDAEGNRVEKQGATVEDTVYFGGQPIARYQAGQWTDLVYGPTGLLAEVPGSQSAPPVYRLTDNLGTNVGSLLANGSFVDAIDHTPFGRVFTGNTADPYSFTGLEHDSESGLEHTAFRQYSPIAGRWMSPDPYDGSMDGANPQSLNRYSYGNNSPLSYADPSGLDPIYTLSLWAFAAGGEVDPVQDVFAGLLAALDVVGDLLLGGFFDHAQLTASHISRPNAQNNSQPTRCQQTVINAVNKQFPGANVNADNILPSSSTYVQPGGQVNVDFGGGPFTSVSPGHYAPGGFWGSITGYGPSLHVVSGPSNLDFSALQFSITSFTAHIDSAWANNPLGALLHWIIDVLGAKTRNPCPSR